MIELNFMACDSGVPFNWFTSLSLLLLLLLLLLFKINSENN